MGWTQGLGRITNFLYYIVMGWICLILFHNGLRSRQRACCTSFLNGIVSLTGQGVEGVCRRSSVTHLSSHCKGTTRTRKYRKAIIAQTSLFKLQRFTFISITRTVRPTQHNSHCRLHVGIFGASLLIQLGFCSFLPKRTHQQRLWLAATQSFPTGPPTRPVCNVPLGPAAIKSPEPLAMRCTSSAGNLPVNQSELGHNCVRSRRRPAGSTHFLFRSRLARRRLEVSACRASRSMR